MITKHIRTFRSKKLNPKHVKILNEAIRHNAKGKQKDVHITYQKENGEVSERKVRPLAVKGKSLFVAHCHERNALRSFRVERINMVKNAFFDGTQFKRIMDHANRSAEESLKVDPAETARNYHDAMYYFGEKGRALRAKNENMTKKAFWGGFTKNAAARSEILSTTFNPLSAVLSPLAGTLGVAVGPYSKKDQEKVNKKSWSNALIPGLAPYRLGRRAAGTGLSDEERDNK